MSLYNDPRYFQKFSQELKSTVRTGAGYRGGEELRQAFEYFKDQENLSSLQSMRLNSKEAMENANVRLKVAEVVTGFTAFGFSEEANQLNAFLKGIGDIADDNGVRDHVFTPK